MKLILLFLLLAMNFQAFPQSKAVTRFRETHPESSNLFFYRSTLQMLNTDNNPELADLLKDIEEIRILNYDLSKQELERKDFMALKKELEADEYRNMMIMTEKNNSIYLYGRDKKGKTVGLVAFVENNGTVMLIDLAGSVDVKKFMELKDRIDTRNIH